MKKHWIPKTLMSAGMALIGYSLVGVNAYFFGVMLIYLAFVWSEL